MYTTLPIAVWCCPLLSLFVWLGVLRALAHCAVADTSSQVAGDLVVWTVCRLFALVRVLSLSGGLTVAWLSALMVADRESEQESG